MLLGGCDGREGAFLALGSHSRVTFGSGDVIGFTARAFPTSPLPACIQVSPCRISMSRLDHSG